MLLNVIDANPFRADAGVPIEHVQNHARALIFVLQVRRVDKDQFLRLRRQFDVLQEHGAFIAGVLVEANFPYPQHIGLSQIAWNELDDFSSQGDIFRLFGIDAEPRVMLNAESACPFRLDLREVAKIVIKAVHRAAIESSPEGRFTDRHAATPGHAVIIVRGSGDHVDVWVDVVHGRVSLNGNWPTRGCLMIANGDRKEVKNAIGFSRRVRNLDVAKGAKLVVVDQAGDR